MSITPRVIQRTPDLGIKIKLQRLPVAEVQVPAQADAPALTLGVMLLPDFVPGLDFEPEFEFYAASGLFYGWLLRPEFEAWRLIGGYTHIESPWQTSKGQTTLRAIALADASEVSWKWTLDMPALPTDASYGTYWDGVEIEEQDGTLKITVLPGEYSGSEQWWATLTCIASAGATELGRVVLRPGLNLNDYGSLPLPSST